MDNEDKVKMAEEKTFLKITNQMVWDKLGVIDSKIDIIKGKNDIEHAAIISKQDDTNGKVKFGTKVIWAIISAGGTGFIFLVTILFRHINIGG